MEFGGLIYNGHPLALAVLTWTNVQSQEGEFIFLPSSLFLFFISRVHSAAVAWPRLDRLHDELVADYPTHPKQVTCDNIGHVIASGHVLGERLRSNASVR